MSKVLTHTCTGACMRDVPGSINFESWGKCPREKGASRNFSFSFNLLFTGLFPVDTQYKRKPCFCIKTRQKNNKKCRLNDTFLYGGEIGIRTLVRFTAVTRFPVVRLRPAQPSLHKSRANDGTKPHLFPLVKSYVLFI